MLRLHEEAPCQQAMTYYFTIPEKAKRFSGRKRSTLPAILNEDIKEAAKTKTLPVSCLESLDDLIKLKKIAENRKRWKEIVTFSMW